MGFNFFFEGMSRFFPIFSENFREEDVIFLQCLVVKMLFEAQYGWFILKQKKIRRQHGLEGDIFGEEFRASLRFKWWKNS